MARAKMVNKKELPKIDDISLRKINRVFKRSILHSILKILVMDYNAYRTPKHVKNINRLFSHLDEAGYRNNVELKAYLWCIATVSKQWLEGIVNIDLIMEKITRSNDFDNIKEGILKSCLDDKDHLPEQEVRAIFEIISETLQLGFLASIRDDCTTLLDEVDIDQPGSFKKLGEQLFTVAQALIDIKHNTNFISNKFTLNTSDSASLKNALTQTIESLGGTQNALKVGIRRWNTLLSPAYMNGRLYVYLGLPASFKSGTLLKSALDIRKYNPGFKTKTPGMKPCVLFITMENSFTETIERIWNMTFDDSITNYKPEQAYKMISEELGIGQVRGADDGEYVVLKDQAQPDGTPTELKLDMMLDATESTEKTPNIEIVVQYYSYREISTDDLFTIIRDLRDENLEVCAFVFDYIKRIRPNVPVADNVKLELNRIINELKALSVIMDMPVITAHQMNRAAAATVDNAARQGKGDVTKLVGREHVGDSWEVVETADWACVLNLEEKPGTHDRYLVMNVVKRRRVDSSSGDVSKHTYLAHPFAKQNQFRLLDDLRLDKVLSLHSLVVDPTMIEQGKKNAVPRLKVMDAREFKDEDNYIDSRRKDK